MHYRRELPMAGLERQESLGHQGHFILRIHSPSSCPCDGVYVIEEVRTGRRARYEHLHEALAFIQAHLTPETE
jgi:hypothetical protein